jgi:hypothetical protein
VHSAVPYGPKNSLCTFSRAERFVGLAICSQNKLLYAWVARSAAHGKRKKPRGHFKAHVLLPLTDFKEA